MSVVVRSRFGRSVRRLVPRPRYMRQSTKETILILSITVAAITIVSGLLYALSDTSASSDVPAVEIVVTPDVGAESFYVDTVDGKRVPCVAVPQGISCNWEQK